MEAVDDQPEHMEVCLEETYEDFVNVEDSFGTDGALAAAAVGSDEEKRCFQLQRSFTIRESQYPADFTVPDEEFQFPSPVQ